MGLFGLTRPAARSDASESGGYPGHGGWPSVGFVLYWKKAVVHHGRDEAGAIATRISKTGRLDLIYRWTPLEQEGGEETP
jgi:hypothetical protein